MFSDDLKRRWGFHPMQDSYLHTLQVEQPCLVPAKVIFSSHDHYKLLFLGDTVERFARLRGHFYHLSEELPVVGDWVAVELKPSDQEVLRIEAILPRLASLKRHDATRGYQVLVANIDSVGIVTSFNRDLKERRLERGLAMVAESGASPLIILNKSDLVEPAVVESTIRELSLRFKDVPLIPCSAHLGSGIDEIKSHLGLGKSVTFLGMSGVGKSTLINAILGTSKLTTGEIRDDDSRGRHTTTHREVVHSTHGFWLIDSPGIREFSFHGGNEVIESTFGDLSQLMTMCRFGNCSHEGEKGCAISMALESGELSQDRWENFLKMKRENEFRENKNNKRYQSEKSKENAKRNSDLRKILKLKGRKL